MISNAIKLISITIMAMQLSVAVIEVTVGRAASLAGVTLLKAV